MSWLDTLKTLAPTVASALGGPLAGAAVTAIGGMLGMSEPTQEKIAQVIANGQLTGEQITELRKLEAQYKNEEAERGFKYSQLEFQDRDSARKLLIQTQSTTPTVLTWVIVLITLLAEAMLIFQATPPGVDPIILGRVLGTMDSALIMVLSFWFGSNSNSARKTELLAAASPAPTTK